MAETRKAAPDYLLIGHMTADLTEQGRILGGTVSYAARTVSAFGLRCAVLTSATQDDELLPQLREYADEVVVIPAKQTSTFENRYLPDGRQQYIRGVAAPLLVDHLPPAWQDTPLVHLGPLTGEVNPHDWLNQFPNARTMMTGQGLLRQWDDTGRVTFRSWLDATVLRKLDWFVLSEEDIVLAPHLEQEYASVAQNFVLTRAEKGGTHYTPGGASTYHTPQVEVVHPTGAGDIFAAALLCALHLLDGDTGIALYVAATLAATSVTRYGMEGAPNAAEVSAIIDAAKARKDNGAFR